MTGRKLRPEELDRLLCATLQDSPAPGEEEQLRAAMRRAWADARAAAAPAARPLVVAPWRLRAALGVAAGLMLVFGLGLHLAFPPRLVADSFAARASSLRALAQLRRAVAMQCVLDAAEEAGRARRYHVDWRAPDEARVLLEGPDGAAWERRVPPRQVGLLAGQPGESTEDDPRLSVVRDVLSPDRVVRLLDGRVRVKLDETTGLPIRLDAGWTATCAFRLAEPSPLPLVGATGRGR